ncbi:hypothetical protein [Thermus scotoductus]|uniref:Uncharacterized protein n=1 Tax=Thermus scotoductus TaxID=37636 RepID=A0A430V3Y0_THESC|nr:hypothetical protein [Thermus scotoductus]RTI17804.1 hypothetical protein CSW27_00870 [Thermus scotoductus]
MLGPWVPWEAVRFHQQALLEEAARERLLRPLKRSWRRRLARFLLALSAWLAPEEAWRGKEAAYGG